MKYTKFISSVLLGTISMIAIDFLVHAILLQEIYHTTEHLWRSVEDMQDKVIFIYISRFFHLLAVVGLYEWISKHIKISPILYGALVGGITGAGGAGLNGVSGMNMGSGVGGFNSYSSNTYMNSMGGKGTGFSPEMNDSYNY